ncbi:glutathione synthetase-like [Pleurodeles waltl]|uniref:glutathione synthetase-like n=1 Tax=Pleurodeles waltl TaxID=8319 RepID=UPI0037096EBC
MARVWDDVLYDHILVKEIIQIAVDAALLQGSVRRTQEQPNTSKVVSYCPFALLPSPAPKALFHQARAVHQDFNLLVDLVSQDYVFLENALASAGKVNDFIAQLFKIYKQVLKEGIAQTVFLGLNRSDYMFHCKADGTMALKQIEINTVCVGFGGMTSKVTEVYKHVLNVLGKSKEASELLPNDPAKRIANGIATAWELYGSEKAVVMVLVGNVQMFRLDHRCFEHKLWKRNILVIHRKFKDVSERASLDKDRRLYIDGHEVAVAYFRTGYLPEDYSEQGWEARLLMERSRAVKCPDVATHLAGTKKVQQELSRPGALERFLPGKPEAVARIRATYAGLYSLDEGEEGDRNAAMAIKNPERFVLKTQQDGGGNNIYGDGIKQVLENNKEPAEWRSCTLMDKLKPYPIRNYLLKAGGDLKIKECITEPGIYGVYVRQGTDMILNEQVGHILRTKTTEQAVGGVEEFMDMPYLVNSYEG